MYGKYTTNILYCIKYKVMVQYRNILDKNNKILLITVSPPVVLCPF